jgi:hypothetical protein
MLTFRRQLWSLARTSPAYAAGGQVAVAGYDAYADTYADEYGDGVVEFDGYSAGYHDDPEHLDELDHRSPEPAPAAVRPTAYRRRRRVLSLLLIGAVATVPAAVVLGGVSWWVAQGVADALLVLYVSLLVVRHRRLVERAQKVRYLTPIRAPRPAVVVLRGAVR